MAVSIKDLNRNSGHRFKKVHNRWDLWGPLLKILKDLQNSCQDPQGSREDLRKILTDLCTELTDLCHILSTQIFARSSQIFPPSSQIFVISSQIVHNYISFMKFSLGSKKNLIKNLLVLNCRQVPQNITTYFARLQKQ